MSDTTYIAVINDGQCRWDVILGDADDGGDPDVDVNYCDYYEEGGYTLRLQYEVYSTTQTPDPDREKDINAGTIDMDAGDVEFVRSGTVSISEPEPPCAGSGLGGGRDW